MFIYKYLSYLNFCQFRRLAAIVGFFSALSGEMSKTTWVALVVVGAIGFLNILACAVFLTSRKRKNTRKSKIQLSSSVVGSLK